MSNIGEKIVELQKDLEIKKNDKARHEGALTTITDKLKKDYNCTTLQESKEVLSTMTTDLKKRNKKLNTLVATYEEDYNA